MTTETKWSVGVSTLLGLYLIISPFAVVDVSSTVMQSNVIAGAIIAIISGYYYLTDKEMSLGGAIVDTLAGLWTLASAFVLGMTGAGRWSNIIVGILVAIFSIYMISKRSTTQSTSGQQPGAN